ncbi:biotin--[acetyl-CoA-carboxylase] ligase [Mucilaginibacter daejeonensis]|uniref:biotin--[acetyl-CoA-carboxylase] ligase n=1 Tax=Mucilaginibacter daejeonensis TaxID=398049 RepID=UPI001D178268|nr:biotin--[acetyl-CoA-carboxylase] ligase [Mucilaginibacter daejeonensis]UEG53929.1 biotin--[acetyl-CoA-carboxylase] ligase [Mucilaginibacter daejeonensis]
MILKEVDSTNTYLKQMLANNEPVAEGTAIMAESQTAGRGQQLNKWYSTTGESLAFSFVISPTFLPIARQFDLTRVVSLGVYGALRPLVGDPLKIKWPNDIYIGDRKLGGILIENQLKGSNIKHTVVGIGLNINQSWFPEWVPNPTSLRQTLHKDHDPKEILAQLCVNIDHWYDELKQGATEIIQRSYLDTLYRFNISGRFKAQDIIFEGRIVGVTPQGLLQVQQAEGTREYDLKQIQFIHH